MSDLYHKIRELEALESGADGGAANSPTSLAGSLGQAMYELAEELYPICRSITGDGVRKTFEILGRLCPLEQFEVPSGTPVFDWEVPLEWNVNDAFVRSPSGKKIIDFQSSNLHLVSYSVPTHRVVGLSELKDHLFSIPENPDWIPYRTRYYSEGWGFCVTDRLLQSLEEGEYEVVIDTNLSKGSLTYAEARIPGATEQEILLFAHCCHPSLCNDNLSGLAVLSFVARTLASCSLFHSVRIVFAPATIGSITWLSQNRESLSNIEAGIVASVLGDSGYYRLKSSRRGDTLADQASQHVLRHCGEKYEILDFSPWGYDERQFCSPGIDLPMVRLTRSPNGEYPEYHTSADNLELIKPESLFGSLMSYLRVIAAIECNATYINTSPFCEPQLGRRGLYRDMGGFQDVENITHAMLWMLNQSDGQHSLLDIADMSELPCELLHEAAQLLANKGLLEIAEHPSSGVDE